jgi:hypothetical protein
MGIFYHEEHEGHEGHEEEGRERRPTVICKKERRGRVFARSNLSWGAMPP